MRTPTYQVPSRTVSTSPRPGVARWRALIGLGAALALSLAALPAPASAASCGALLQSLATYLTSGVSGANVDMHHTTNYQANGFWATAHTWGALSRATNGALLRTETPRFWANGWTEFITIDFYADESVRFNDQYGPYPTQCYGDKFLIVNTGDSFETFSFEKNIFIINYPARGPRPPGPARPPTRRVGKHLRGEGRGGTAAPPRRGVPSMLTLTLIAMVFAAVMLLTAMLGLCSLGLPPRESAAPHAPGSHAPRHP